MLQYGMWDSIALSHRPIGVLPPPMEAYADRFVLQVEQSGEDLGAVDVASFRLGQRFFLLSQITDVEDTGVTVWLDRRQSHDEERPPSRRSSRFWASRATACATSPGARTQ
ncbi:hypothetical protein ACFWWM_25740 [Streptomyces sp. NPDC058682]|uniref:hypothetical protein n=1 Tax=unclassified Streptomyces TaxID=2593676 RepID=UPI00224C7E40|nr:hypothetical protein [Streptomyces sp. NBC_01214]MCX4804594.1 hypothetical protein [Streptomyces sp. NBC_01214]